MVKEKVVRICKMCSQSFTTRTKEKTCSKVCKFESLLTITPQGCWVFNSPYKNNLSLRYGRYFFNIQPLAMLTATKNYDSTVKECSNNDCVHPFHMKEPVIIEVHEPWYKRIGKKIKTIFIGE